MHTLKPVATFFKLNGNFIQNALRTMLLSRGSLTGFQQTVKKLPEQPNTANKAGTLLGKVQSGKTKTFTRSIVLAF